jgi:hypothetical protein
MQKRTIEQWMHDAIVDEGYRRFDDLHVDEIDPRYEEPSLWLQGVVAALDEAASIRDRRNWAFTVAAGISLTSSDVAQGETIKQPGDVVRQFDETPPSLYVFPKGAEPWTTEHQVYTEMLTGAVVADSRARCYFSEKFDKSDNEYRRTVWVSR